MELSDRSYSNLGSESGKTGLIIKPWVLDRKAGLMNEKKEGEE